MILIGLGRLGRDAELRYTPSGDAITNLALAFNYGKKENDKQPTQWVDATLYGKRAASLAPYCLKGQQFMVSLDDPHIEVYKKKDGSEGFSLKAFVGKIEFAGPKPQASAPAPKKESAPAPRPGSFDDMDDDIPF